VFRRALQVLVEKGMKHGQKITFRGEGDESPGMDPGDVVFVLQCKDHPRYVTYCFLRIVNERTLYVQIQEKKLRPVAGKKDHFVAGVNWGGVRSRSA
jgi:DnaJ-class molecular chaperone